MICLWCILPHVRMSCFIWGHNTGKHSSALIYESFCEVKLRVVFFSSKFNYLGWPHSTWNSSSRCPCCPYWQLLPSKMFVDLLPSGWACICLLSFYYAYPLNFFFPALLLLFFITYFFQTCNITYVSIIPMTYLLLSFSVDFLLFSLFSNSKVFGKTTRPYWYSESWLFELGHSCHTQWKQSQEGRGKKDSGHKTLLPQNVIHCNSGCWNCLL